MPRQPTAELNDFYAFMSVQMAAYLVRKPNRRFASEVERETIFKIIVDAWKSLSSSPTFADSDSCVKLQLFRRVRPGFPFFGMQPRDTTIVRGSFAAKSSFAPAADRFGQRCSCGSGLSYSRCCGRVKGLGEL
jgi:hypothetical protein